MILPVVICLSQRLSHACLCTSLIKVKPRMALGCTVGYVGRSFHERWWSNADLFPGWRTSRLSRGFTRRGFPKDGLFLPIHSLGDKWVGLVVGVTRKYTDRWPFMLVTWRVKWKLIWARQEICVLGLRGSINESWWGHLDCQLFKCDSSSTRGKDEDRRRSVGRSYSQDS